MKAKVEPAHVKDDADKCLFLDDSFPSFKDFPDDVIHSATFSSDGNENFSDCFLLGKHCNSIGFSQGSAYFNSVPEFAVTFEKKFVVLFWVSISVPR